MKVKSELTNYMQWDAYRTEPELKDGDYLNIPDLRLSNHKKTETNFLKLNRIFNSVFGKDLTITGYGRTGNWYHRMKINPIDSDHIRYLAFDIKVSTLNDQEELLIISLLNGMGLYYKIGKYHLHVQTRKTSGRLFEKGVNALNMKSFGHFDWFRFTYRFKTNDLKKLTNTMVLKAYNVSTQKQERSLTLLEEIGRKADEMGAPEITEIPEIPNIKNWILASIVGYVTFETIKLLRN